MKRVKKAFTNHEIPSSSNLCIIGVPEGAERGKGTERLFKEEMAENFPNLER